MSSKKNKRHKLKKRFLITLFIVLLSLIIATIYIIEKPIQNIYIKGNKILSDKEIIEIAKLSNYPSFINTYFLKIENKLLKSDYIKKVNITRKLFGKIYIEIEEYRPISIYNDKIILSSGKKIENKYDINYIPYVINNIDSIYNKYVEKFSLINDDILMKISHVEYTPNDVDKERFLLSMVDSNYVYITLSKIEKINKYNSIINKLENKKGIIYLDSGDYVEIKG